MSWFTQVDVRCPSCSHDFIGHTADTINIARVPRARDLVLEGEFHVETCPECKTRITIERNFMYTDFGRRQFIHVFSRHDEGKWAEREEVARATFWGGFKNAPPKMQTLARECRVRAVFGVARLAEKVRIWQAELDDALVELLKLELTTGEAELVGRGNLELLMMGLTEDGSIKMLVRERGGGPDAEVTIFAMARRRYDELAADRERLVELWPRLFHNPYVSYRRLASEPATSRSSE